MSGRRFRRAAAAAALGLGAVLGALAVLHGGVNRAILSHALTGERMFLGHFEQAPACVNVLDLGEGGEWIVRAVNVAAYDVLHLAHRQTTMERYWEQYRLSPDP